MFIANKKSIGIDIADHSIEIAEVGKQGGEVRVFNLGRVVLAPGIVVDGRIKDAEKLDKALKTLFLNSKPSPINPGSIYLGLPEKQVFTHYFMFDPKGSKEDEEVIDKEARSTIPLEEHELVYSHNTIKTQIIDEAKKEKIKNKTTIVSSSREVLLEWMSFFKKLKIDIIGFDTESMAMYRGLFKKQPDYPVCVVDIGSATTNIYIYSDGSLCYSHTINKAGDQFTNNIAEIRKSADGSKIGLADAEVLKMETGLLKAGKFKDEIYLVLSNGLRSIQAEIKLAMDFYHEHNKKDVLKVIFVGGTSRMKGLLDYFMVNMQSMSAKSTDSSSDKKNLIIEIGKSAYIDSSASLQYIEAIGIAVRGVEKKKYKNSPLLVAENEDKKSKIKVFGKKDKKRPDNNDAEKSEIIVKKNSGNWLKAHPKETQLLFILLLGILLIGWAFWYRSHNEGKEAKSPVFESKSFDYMQETSRTIPVAISASEYAGDRIKGRIILDSIEVATTLKNALEKSKEKISAVLKRGEILWDEPLNFPENDEKLVFPLEISWLVFSETDAKNFYILDIKKNYEEEFLFDHIEFKNLEPTENKNLYDLESSFYYLTSEDIGEKKEIKDEVGAEESEEKEIDENKDEMINSDNIQEQDNGEIVESEEEKNKPMTLEELQKSLMSAKNSKKEGYVTILDTGLGWLNVRSGPSTENSIVTTVLSGDSYLLLDELDNWSKIDLGNDISGWVSSDYIQK